MRKPVERSEGTGSQRAVKKQYHRRTMLGVAMYVLVLIPTVLLLNAHPDAPWRVPLALLPVLPIVYGLRSMRKYFLEADELQKRIQLEGFAFGFAGAAMATLTYGFLEMAGFPRLTAWWYWTAMGACWIAGTLLANRSYR